MAIRIAVNKNRDDPTSPRLLTVLTSAWFAKRWIGREAPRLQQLQFEENKPILLYFRTTSCTICDLIDMRVAQACKKVGVQLIVIDRYSKEEDQSIYEQPTNVLDKGGVVNEAYGIGVYPSFVLVNDKGRIVMKDVGNKAKADVFDRYLQERFQAQL